MSAGSSCPSYLPPSCDGALCGLFEREMPGLIPVVIHARASDAVVVGPAAEIPGGDLQQLLLRVHRAGMIRSRHRVHGLAAVGCARPGKVPAGVAPDDLDPVPRHVEHLGGDARRVDDRVRAEVAGARLHVELAVGPNRHQAVVADRVAADERADRDADSPHLGAGPLSAARLALVPFEELDAAIDGLADKRTGDVAAFAVLAGGAERRLAFGCVDAMQRHRIDSQLSRRLREQRLHDRVLLQPAGPPLRRRGRGVREHREAAETHRHRLVGKRAHGRRRFEIVLILVGAGVLQHEHVHGRDTAVLAEAGPDPRQQRWPAAADEMLLFTADAHHHRRAGLLREQRRNGDGVRPGNLAAEAAARVFADHARPARA